jgi:hydrogenase maturation factor
MKDLPVDNAAEGEAVRVPHAKAVLVLFHHPRREKTPEAVQFCDGPGCPVLAYRREVKDET